MHWSTVLLPLLVAAADAKKCRPKARAAPTSMNDINSAAFADDATTIRAPTQYVYFWPSLIDAEKAILRDAFHQIARRTCIMFEEQEYKPWYHADRWDAEKPYVLIRKSKKYSAYSDNTVEGLVGRTILYVAENAFQMDSFNHSRGAVMDQLVRFMGMRRELYRPDAPSYIQSISPVPLARQPQFHSAQLEWPFDPESITIPLWARDRYVLTEYCPARNNVDIGAAQRVGLLTRWDTVKLNAMYCPGMLKDADPKRGPCVVPRKKDLDEFRRRVWAYKKLNNRLN